MTNQICWSPIQGTVLRVLTLDTCGRLVTGASSAQLVMDGFIQVQVAPQYDTGDRKITRKANGTICVNKKMPDQFTNDEVTIDLCSINPGLLVATIGGRLLTGALSPTGVGWAHGTNNNAAIPHWSLEVWQPPDEASCASGTPLYSYWFFPHLSDGKKGTYTFSEDPTQMQIIANTYDGNPQWFAGNSWLNTAIIAGEHQGGLLTATAPPSSVCSILAFP